jgi:hypothetical protein
MSLYVWINEFISADPGAYAFTGSLIGVGVLKKAFAMIHEFSTKIIEYSFRKVSLYTEGKKTKLFA